MIERLLQLPGRRVLVLGPLLLVSVQVFVNYRVGAISDLNKLYFTHDLSRHPIPYLDARIEYPVLIGIYMTLAAALTSGLPSYLVVSSLGLWACAIGTTAVLWSLSRRAAWWFALCPLLSVYSLLNWDLLAILFLVLGWRAWKEVNYLAAAIWLTLGTFTKLYPAFLLAFCFVELLRRRHHGLASGRDLARFCGAVTAAGAVLNVPFMVLAFGNWSYFFAFNAARNEQAGVLFSLGLLNHASVSTTNVVLVATVLASVIVGSIAIWRGAHTIEVASTVFFVFMLIQKVYSPQYTLWLVAFALLAEWDFWTICVLSMMGLSDYASAVIHIALVRQHVGFVAWYQQRIAPLDRGLRLVSTAAVSTAMAARAVVLRARDAELPDRSATEVSLISSPRG